MGTVLVLAGTELIFLLVAATVLCFVLMLVTAVDLHGKGLVEGTRDLVW